MLIGGRGHSPPAVLNNRDPSVDSCARVYGLLVFRAFDLRLAVAKTLVDQLGCLDLGPTCKLICHQPLQDGWGIRYGIIRGDGLPLSENNWWVYKKS